MAWYLKWPTDAGSGPSNNKLCQLSGIATSGNVNISLEFAENIPATASQSSYGYYLYDGRRTLDSTTQGAGGYILKYAGTVEQSGTSNYKLNGVTSNVNAWQTAIAGDVYSFDSGAQADGVISVGSRFNQAEMLPGLTLKKIIITDSGGTHTIDMSLSGGTLNQFTSTDGVVTLKLFGFTGSSHWIEYSPPVVVKKNLWRNFPTGSIKPSAFIPWDNAEPIISEFWQAPPATEGAAISLTMPQMTASVVASKTVPVVSASISIAMPQMTVAATASNVAAGFSASVAFTMPQMSVSAAASKSVPVYSGAITVTMPQMTAAVSASKSVPIYSATVSATMPQMQFAASASNSISGVSASIALTMPQMSAAITASKSVPVSNASIAFAMPQMLAASAASNLVPSYPAAISVSMPQMAVAASASNYVEGISAAITFTMPQMRVTAYADGVIFYAAENAHIEQPFRSRLIEAPVRSTALTITARSANINQIAKSRHIAYNYQSTHIEKRSAQNAIT